MTMRIILAASAAAVVVTEAATSASLLENNLHSNVLRRHRALSSSTIAPTPTTPILPFPLRINLGGAATDASLDDVVEFLAYDDFSFWIPAAADVGDVVAETHSNHVPATGTQGVEAHIPPLLYESWIKLLDDGTNNKTEFTLTFPLPTTVATLRLRLHFVEPDDGSSSAPRRVVSVRVNGRRRIFDLDVFRRVGTWSAYVWDADDVVAASDGVLTIQFSKEAGEIAVCGLEVLPCDFPVHLKTGGTASGFVSVPYYLFGRESSIVFSDSATITDESSSTYAQDIYQSGRKGTGFKYVIPIPRGTVESTVLLRLHFREDDAAITQHGERVFDVLVNGEAVLYQLDVYKLMGDSTNAAYRWTGYVQINPTTADIEIELVGRLNLQTLAVTEATICAIQVLSGGVSVDSELIMRRGPRIPSFTIPEEAAIQVTSVAKYNMGAVTDTVTGWSSPNAHLTSSSGGGGAGADATHTNDPDMAGLEDGLYDSLVYASERNGIRLVYEFPVSGGEGLYMLRLHFSERTVNAAKERLFDVIVQDQVEIYRLDIYDEAGQAQDTAYRAEVYTWVPSDSTVLKVEFLAHTPAYPAKIDGIEIFSVTSKPTSAPTPKPTYGPCVQLYYRRNEADGLCHYDATMCHYNTDCRYPETNWCDQDTNRCKSLYGREDPLPCTDAAANCTNTEKYDCIYGYCRWKCSTSSDCEHAPITALGESLTCYEGLYCGQSCTDDIECPLPLGQCDTELGTCIATTTPCTANEHCNEPAEECDTNLNQCVEVQ